MLADFREESINQLFLTLVIKSSFLKGLEHIPAGHVGKQGRERLDIFSYSSDKKVIDIEQIKALYSLK